MMECFRVTSRASVPRNFRNIVLAASIAGGVIPSSAFADGGTIRLSETKGAYRISALTAPNPFRAGPVEISVLVQDADTADASPDAKVKIRIAPRDQLSEVREFSATFDGTTNKLFRSAAFDLPAPGRWTVEIDVDGPKGPVRSSFEVEAGGRLPRWVSLWAWFSWPFAVVALFALHRAFAVNRTARRPVRGKPHASGTFPISGGR
jgi:hypothetical protein